MATLRDINGAVKEIDTIELRNGQIVDIEPCDCNTNRPAYATMGSDDKLGVYFIYKNKKYYIDTIYRYIDDGGKFKVPLGR